MDNYMKKNHKKAREFCEREVYIEEGAEENFFGMISSEVHRALPDHCTLSELMSGFGTEFAYGQPKDAIGILEAIYEVLNHEKAFININKLNLKDINKPPIEDNTLNNDELFDIAFVSMLKKAEQRENEDLLKVLKELYLEPEQETSGVSPIGETGSGDM